jgi:hypothetical protein
MAVIEIAKIQVRRGQELQTGQPLTLDSGEFGWAIDTQKLYIGNGTVGEGAPAEGITEILTSASNIFDLTGSYVYRGNTDSSPVITGPSYQGNNTHRTIQQKLDDIVNITDFGVTPHLTNTETVDGVPIYSQIQQAIDEIFLNSDKTNPASRRKLLFPAGNYVITGTIYIPPYATIIGDGLDKTVLQLTTSSASIFQFADGTSQRGGPYVYNENITSGGRPKNIYIEGITFEYSGVAKAVSEPLLVIDGAEDCQVTNCKFIGEWPDSDSNSKYTAIDLRSQGAIISQNISITNNVFYGVKVGVKSNYNIEDIKIVDNKFNRLYRGITYGESPEVAQQVGAVRTSIINNQFDTIKAEGVYVGTNGGKPTSHVVSFNSFVNVGNNLAGDGTGTNYIINFLTQGNVAVENKFERETFIATSADNDSMYPPSVQGKVYIESNKTFSSNLLQGTIYSPNILTRLPYSDSDQKIKLQYIVNKPSVGFSRKGELTINVYKVDVEEAATVTDSYTYVDVSGTYGDSGITFSAVVDIVTKQVKIFYSNVDTLGTIDYQYSYLQQ